MDWRRNGILPACRRAGVSVCGVLRQINFTPDIMPIGCAISEFHGRINLAWLFSAADSG